MLLLSCSSRTFILLYTLRTIIDTSLRRSSWSSLDDVTELDLCIRSVLDIVAMLVGTSCTRSLSLLDEMTAFAMNSLLLRIGNTVGSCTTSTYAAKASTTS